MLVLSSFFPVSHTLAVISIVFFLFAVFCSLEPSITRYMWSVFIVTVNFYVCYRYDEQLNHVADAKYQGNDKLLKLNKSIRGPCRIQICLQFHDY
jgi:hypothetical protein